MSWGFKDFQDYIKELATKNKLVRHGKKGRKSFFRMDGEEALAAIPNNAASPYVVIIDFNGLLRGKMGEKVQQSAEIWFITNVNTRTGSRADATEASQENSYQIMMQFIAKIIADYEEGNGCDTLQNLLTDQIGFGKIGPINQNGYGWTMHLSFRNPTPLHNENDWEE